MTASTVFGLLLGALCAATAAAQQARDDGGGSARLQAMVQQLTTEKAELQVGNAKLKVDLDKANAELKALRDAQAGLERRLGASESSLTQATALGSRTSTALEQQRTRMEEIVAQFRETIEVLRTTELERNELRAALGSRESALKQCVTNNEALFTTGNEVLDRYEQKGCFSSLRENEPFMQVKRVQLQNLVDEYRWALEDQRLPATLAPTPVPAPAPSN